MDDHDFDLLTRLLSSGSSRRAGLRAAFGVAIAGFAGASVEAKRQRKRSRRGKGRKRKAAAQAVAASCFTGSPCMVGPAKYLAKCNFEDSTAFNGANCKGCNASKSNLHRADARGVNFTNANLSDACLVEANLSGGTLKNANMLGAIFCRTTMPNGSISNAGCSKVTSCCPTCIALGGNCGAGIGGSCCSGARSASTGTAPARPPSPISATALAPTCRPTARIAAHVGRAAAAASHVSMEGVFVAAGRSSAATAASAARAATAAMGSPAARMRRAARRTDARTSPAT